MLLYGKSYILHLQHLSIGPLGSGWLRLLLLLLLLLPTTVAFLVATTSGVTLMIAPCSTEDAAARSIVVLFPLLEALGLSIQRKRAQVR